MNKMDAERKRPSMASSNFMGVQKTVMPKPGAKKASSMKAQDATKQLAAMLSMRRQVPVAKQQASQRRASAAVGGQDRMQLDRRASSGLADTVALSPKPLRGGQRRATLPAAAVVPEQQQELPVPVASVSDFSGEARPALDHCLSYWSASDSMLLLIAVVREWHHLILIYRQGIPCKNARAQMVLDASFAYWCANEDLLLLSKGMQAWLYVLLCVEKKRSLSQSCAANRLAALFETCFRSWGASANALMLTVAMQIWRECVQTFNECKRPGATRRTGEELLLQMRIIRIWRDCALYRHADEVASKHIQRFQLCAVVFLTWSDDAKERRKLSEQVSRNSMFLQSFAEEQSSLHSLRDRLDGFRQDLLSRERDIREREVDVRQLVHRANAEKDAAKERAEIESTRAQAEEMACRSANQELAAALKTLASVKDENILMAQRRKSLAQSLEVAEAAASRDALLVVSLREELQAVKKKLESEAAAATSDREALILQLKKVQSDLQAVRDQAGSQGSSFMHLVGQNATLEEQLHELQVAEAGRTDAHAEARAELEAEVLRLKSSEEELAKRRQEFELHVENQEQRNSVIVQAVRDQAEHQNQEYLRLFEASEEQRREISRLHSEEESTRSLKKDLEFLRARLDQREFDLGRQELQLNLMKTRTAAMVENGLRDASLQDDEQNTSLEDDAERSSPRRRCLGGLDQAVD